MVGLATVGVGKTELLLNMPEIRSVSSSYVLYNSSIHFISFYLKIDLELSEPSAGVVGPVSIDMEQPVASNNICDPLSQQARFAGRENHSGKSRLF